jgi:hypothetical protein
MTINARILQEGHGPAAWHGANLKAALRGLTPALAYWRPGKKRHNIAELALHHAYYQHAVRGRLSGVAPEPFVMAGQNFFTLDSEKAMPLKKLLAYVADQQKKLTAVVDGIDAGTITSPLDEAARFKLILGITCHAVYHAGQIQLIKKLRSS